MASDTALAAALLACKAVFNVSNLLTLVALTRVFCVADNRL